MRTSDLCLWRCLCCLLHCACINNNFDAAEKHNRSGTSEFTHDQLD